VISLDRVGFTVVKLDGKRVDFTLGGGGNVVHPVAKLPHDGDSEDQAARLTGKASNKELWSVGTSGAAGMRS
jgi:hypothetical protein